MLLKATVTQRSCQTLTIYNWVELIKDVAHIYNMYIYVYIYMYVYIYISIDRYRYYVSHDLRSSKTIDLNRNAVYDLKSKTE